MADVFENAMFDPRTGSAIVATELNELRLQIISNMYAQNAVASGNTIRSLKVIQEPFSARLVSQQKMPFGVLETGRRGGKIPYGFAGIIYEWMQKKGIHAEPIPYKDGKTHKFTEQERADRSMASAIAKTISRSGTRLFRQGGRDTIYSQDVQKTIDKCRERLSAFLFVAAKESIKLNIKNTKIGRR